MIERSEDLGFTLEAREAVGIEREFGGQDLQRDVAIEPGVARSIDLAHAAHAKQAGDFVSAETSAGGQRHAHTLRGMRECDSLPW